jgi:hypothetical protein
MLVATLSAIGQARQQITSESVPVGGLARVAKEALASYGTARAALQRGRLRPDPDDRPHPEEGAGTTSRGTPCAVRQARQRMEEVRLAAVEGRVGVSSTDELNEEITGLYLAARAVIEQTGGDLERAKGKLR